jgi:hypothetical protein
MLLPQFHGAGRIYMIVTAGFTRLWRGRRARREQKILGTDYTDFTVKKNTEYSRHSLRRRRRLYSVFSFSFFHYSNIPQFQYSSIS